MPQLFRLLSEPFDIETIAAGAGIRVARDLHSRYGGKRWLKLKGKAIVELTDGRVVLAELHWFEAHGVGRRVMRVKKVIG